MNEEHALDMKHPYIQSVRYIDLQADVVPGNIEEEIEPAPPSGNSATLTSSFYALAAGAIIVVVGTAVFYRRRRRAAEHDSEATTLAPGTAQLQENPSIQ